MIIGLTGGIGSGKSAAADFFQKEGVEVIDADNLSKEVVKKNTTGYRKVLNYFGKEICDSDGEIDRSELRKQIFNNAEKRTVLEKITHPLVRDRIKEIITTSESPYSIIEVPLIFETNSMYAYDRILVIDCDQNLQLQRASTRDGSSKKSIQKIIDSQCSRLDRLSIANDVISNDDSLENLKIKSLAMHNFYLRKSRK